LHDETNPPLSCREALHALVEYARPPEGLARYLPQTGKPYAGDPVILTRRHVSNVLQRFIASQLWPDDIQAWAELIGIQDGIDYEEGFREILIRIVHELARSTLPDCVNSHLAELYLLQLQSAPADIRPGESGTLVLSPDMPILRWLQWWYLTHCDDVREHDHGIDIGTLDNPGWRVRIDLNRTELFGRKMDLPLTTRDNENDWIHVRCDGEIFEGFGGPNNLEEVFTVFRHFAEGRNLSID
jgi:hypothetical protein